MSLLNDALKQARQSQQPNPPSGLPPMRPVAPAPRGAADWLLPLAVIALVGAGGFFIWLSLARHKTPVAKAPEIPAVPAVARVTNAPAVSNVVAAVPLALPKLQGIVFGEKSWAIVDGQTVYVGDSVENFRVKEISPNSVTLQSPDGSLQKLVLSE
jgi:hypothetical protein